VKTFVFLAVVAGIFSCSGTGSAVSNQLADSDSLVINFSNPQTTQIEKTVTTTESNAIKKLARYTDGKNTEMYKCGYNGNMLFYKKGVLAGDVSFNYADGCLHFLQTVNGKMVSTGMSYEAADFLKGLAAGKDWY
jgi:hypothetical protein